MIRDSLDANAKNFFAFVTPGHGTVLQTRDSTDGGAPLWLKITRVGDVFTASHSKDGQTRTDLGTVTVAMSKSALIGLAVNAHSKGAINLTQFEGVKINQLTRTD